MSSMETSELTVRLSSDVWRKCFRSAVRAVERPCFTRVRVEHPEEPVWSEADGGVDLQEGSELDEISLPLSRQLMC